MGTLFLLKIVLLPFSRNALAHKLLANQKDLLDLCVSLKSLFRGFELGRNLYLLLPALCLLASNLLCCYEFFLHAVLCFCALSTPPRLH